MRFHGTVRQVLSNPRSKSSITVPSSLQKRFDRKVEPFIFTEEWMRTCSNRNEV